MVPESNREWSRLGQAYGAAGYEETRKKGEEFNRRCTQIEFKESHRQPSPKENHLRLSAFICGLSCLRFVLIRVHSRSPFAVLGQRSHEILDRPPFRRLRHLSWITEIEETNQFLTPF